MKPTEPESLQENLSIFFFHGVCRIYVWKWLFI